MINEKCARKYCREDITLIKNYTEAISDKSRTWICHHINAEPFTGFCTEDLKKMNMYYQRPASELKFVTRSEHKSIHLTGTTLSNEYRKKLSESRKGRKASADTKKKMSDAHKGKHLSEETRKKISESHKGKHLSKETRNKISETKRSAKC